MDDFEFTISLLDSFFAQTKIQKSLQIIKNHSISGWETWVQIEFATFLSSVNDIECFREFPLLPDRRKDKQRTMIRPDFILKRKGFSKEEYILLEFKQNSLSTKQCFRGMFNDIKKICSLKGSSAMKLFLGVGIHPKAQMSKAEIKDYILESFEFGLHRDMIQTRFIPNTEFAFTAF